MKTSITYTLTATLAVGFANASAHRHQNFHAKRMALSHAAKRDSATTEYVVNAVETVYVCDGKVLDPEEAKKGLDGGDFVVVGQTTPTLPPPPPVAVSTSKDFKAQFIETKASTSSTPASSSSSSSSPPSTITMTMTSPSAKSMASATSAADTMSVTSTSSSTSQAPTASSKPAAQASNPGSGATGLNAEFPSGKIKCADFPSQYGAVSLEYLDLGGWSGLQFVPSYSVGALSISDIVTGIAGQTCKPGCMCSYACPAGYQKTQWPSAQGSTAQSIGGLFCNSDGFLELTRESSKTLCEPGVGGITIQNDLDEQVCTCRTDYPGTEAMTIPTIAQPGASVPLANPSQSSYFRWQGKTTSAQYYINKKGVSPENACVWNSRTNPGSGGNWAPVILGAGQAADGNTYISIFQNLPTSNAPLDFNIKITGDVNSDCSYIDGKWSGGSNGCTTAMRPGGQAKVRYF